MPSELGGVFSDSSLIKKEPRPDWKGFTHLYISVSTDHGWSPPEPLTSPYGNKRFRIYVVMNVSSLSASCLSLLCSSVVSGKHIRTSLLFSFGMDGLPLVFLVAVFTMLQICDFYECEI